MSINSRIRKYINDHRYTQTEIAKKMGLNKVSLNAALNNKRTISAQELIDFCKAVGEDADFIIRYGDEINEKEKI